MVWSMTLHELKARHSRSPQEHAVCSFNMGTDHCHMQMCLALC